MSKRRKKLQERHLFILMTHLKHLGLLLGLTQRSRKKVRIARKITIVKVVRRIPRLEVRRDDCISISPK